MELTESSGNLFTDIGFDPAEASTLKLRSFLMIAVTNEIERRGITQAKAARLLKVTQPRISDLMRGKVELFSIDSLIEMLTRANIPVTLLVGSMHESTSTTGAHESEKTPRHPTRNDTSLKRRHL